ncbi:HPP family protein [Methanimicrococcus blatticola]|nr:HPP family protein [Methanimicrococcus blatticola]MBZ3936136.1 HPP family protein [Methanimicrococcus blatticola]MCC2508379.1 HPP family protein [Methanimicrococcus blatticola]
MSFMEKLTHSNQNNGKLRLCLIQSTLAGGFVSIFFLMMSYFENGLVVTSLIASIFIVFIFPTSPAAQSRNLVGGHLISAAVGFLCFYANNLLQGADPVFAYTVLFCGLAVFLSTLLMALFGFEHPPAAAFAAGLVLAPSVPILMCLLGLVCVFVLAGSKKLLFPLYCTD